MIRKSEAIVLSTQKFGDSSLICSMYTRAFGRRNFLIKGYRSTRARQRHSYFQPMSIIEVVYYHKDNRELQMVTESHSRYFFTTLQTDPTKITLGMVVVELFHLTVKEEEPNEPLFQFLGQVLVALDQRQDRLIHVFLFYLVQLGGHLGFMPSDLVEDSSLPIHFDLRNGFLENAPIPDKGAAAVLAFSRASLDNCQSITLSQADKSDVISTMMEYYRTHVEGFRIPNSLGVFQEVFGK